jgi:imidazolonepropionase-like amidohydrolase
MALKFTQSLILIGLSSTGAFAQTKDLAIVGAHIETGDGKVIERGTILIHAGKITGVGENVPVLEGTDTIDGKGLFVYPGFIDAYCTEGLKLPEIPSSGTPPDTRNTAPATMWHTNHRGIRSDVVAAKCLDLADRLKENYGMGITTALVTAGSGSVRGIATVVDYIGKGNILLPEAAGELALRGGGGGGGGGYPGTLFGVTALTRQVLIDAQSYAADPNPKKDAGLENLKPLITGQIPALIVADSAREIVRATRLADEFGFKTILYGGRDAFREIGVLKERHIPVILSVDVAEAPSKKVETGEDATPQEVLNERYDAWLEHSLNPKKLNDAGIPIAFSLGSGFAEYLKGIRTMIGEGLPRDVALKAMTSGAASILGVSDKVGTIGVGKLANLVIMSGDFADAKSTIKSVVVEGARIDLGNGGAK